MDSSNIDAQSLRKHHQPSSILDLVTSADEADAVKQLLVSSDCDINYQNEHGETALYIAARFGRQNSAKALIEGTDSQKANLELAESTFAWTPLVVACVGGHIGIVELLINAGAQLDKPDLSGWTAKEHAALRGHLAIARRLAALTTSGDNSSASSVSQSSSLPPSPMIIPMESSPTSPMIFPLDGRKAPKPSDLSDAIRATETVKSFGHRYLHRDALILVSLGSMDTRKNIEPVTLHELLPTDAQSAPLDGALSLVVSASGASGDPATIDLPVRHNVSVEPISFRASDVSKVQLLFDIVPTLAGSAGPVLGRGVALLSSIRPAIGSRRCSLQGDTSVPIVSAGTLQVIGSVHFNFLVITPFSHPNLAVNENLTYWKSTASTMVIGHRGLGKNLPARKSLQLGENTIQSFIAAANLGATYVEFDVQVTKDNVPVIYHDFLVSETGIDAPVHTLTLEQFLHVSKQRAPRASRPASPDDLLGEPAIGGPGIVTGPRLRSLSESSSKSESFDEMKERMRHTRDFRIKGFKGNSRGDFIQAPFTTLEEVFKNLPESIGFNIEMKYPMLSESETEEMDTYAVEPNAFVDSVLEVVYRLGGKRNIIFSSFNPDICLLLSWKQPSIPVLFLTDAGTCPAADVRAGSLQEAIRFASRWNLLGLVTAVEPLILCPRLVRVIKGSGLVCVSYGTMNNTTENVQLQVKEGIDAVIVDNVLAIRQGLTKSKALAEADISPSGGSDTTGSPPGGSDASSYSATSETSSTATTSTTTEV